MKNKSQQQQNQNLKPQITAGVTVPLEQLVCNPAVQFSPDEKVSCGTHCFLHPQAESWPDPMVM